MCTYTHTPTGGQIALGRMQLLLVFINEEHDATLAVSHALLSLLTLLQHASVNRGGEDGGEEGERVSSCRASPCNTQPKYEKGVSRRFGQAAVELHERLRKALPLPMASQPIATSPCLHHKPPGGGRGDSTVWAVSLEGGMCVFFGHASL